YEQVRSIAAALAGDRQAADDVHLVLPETGVCSTDLGGTCDTPTPETTDQGCCTPANAAPVLLPTTVSTRCTLHPQPDLHLGTFTAGLPQTGKCCTIGRF